MTKEEINEAISKGLYNRLGDECLKLDQQNKELQKEIEELEKDKISLKELVDKSYWIGFNDEVEKVSWEYLQGLKRNF